MDILYPLLVLLYFIFKNILDVDANGEEIHIYKKATRSFGIIDARVKSPVTSCCWGDRVVFWLAGSSLVLNIAKPRWFIFHEIALTPGSKALQPLVIGEPEPFFDVHIEFWRFLQNKTVHFS